MDGYLTIFREESYMDLSDYLKKSRVNSKANNYALEKKCLACGKTCQNQGSHLYYQKFCCQECKDIYIHSGR